MLFEPDKRMLGDSHLDARENVIKLREMCLKFASRYITVDQEELQNAGRSEGTRLPYTELLKRLRKICPTLTVKEGSPGNLALYYPRTSDELYEALTDGGYSTDVFFIFNKYVGGIPKEELPEWGYVDIDTSLIATREHIRGWRTILIGLLLAGAVSYAEAVKEFGDPALDKRNSVWMKKTLEWREAPAKKFTLGQYLKETKNG